MLVRNDQNYDLQVVATTGGKHVFPNHWFNNKTNYNDTKLAGIQLSDEYNRFFNSRFGLQGIIPYVPPLINVFAQWLVRVVCWLNFYKL